MKMQITVRTFTGGVSIVEQSDWSVCDEKGLAEAKAFIKQIAVSGPCLIIGDTVIPGEFLRSSCVVDIRTEA
jgi:hypothetical protein